MPPGSPAKVNLGQHLHVLPDNHLVYSGAQIAVILPFYGVESAHEPLLLFNRIQIDVADTNWQKIDPVLYFHFALEELCRNGLI